MPMHPDQVMLFGQSVEEALPEDNDVRCFADVMDYLDYSALEDKCPDRGCPPYPPQVMVKVLEYAYSKGIRSSRQIESLCRVDVRFIWLAGGLKPDHNTIARFRKNNHQQLKELFVESVRVCAEAGLVLLNAVYTDGTKLEAAASKRRVYSHSKLERHMVAIEKVLREAEEVDAKEDQIYGDGTGNEMPEDLRDATTRRAKLKEIARRLKDSKRTAVVETDADARVMMTRQGKHPAYNLQASVDEKNQVIVAMELTQNENDVGLLPEMVEQIEQNTGLSPDVSVVDAGYANQETLEWLDEKHDALMVLQEGSAKNDRNNLFASRCFLEDEERDVLICPAGRDLSFRGESQMGSGTYRRYCANGCQSCSFYRQCVPKGGGSRRVSISVVARKRRAMQKKLESEEGKRLCEMRRQTAEPVFGQMKRNKGMTRLICWGKEGAVAESALMCIAHNVAKCVSSATARAYITASVAVRFLVCCLTVWFGQMNTGQTPNPINNTKLAHGFETA
jgi:transposase